MLTYGDRSDAICTTPLASVCKYPRSLTAYNSSALPASTITPTNPPPAAPQLPEGVILKGEAAAVAVAAAAAAAACAVVEIRGRAALESWTNITGIYIC